MPSAKSMIQKNKNYEDSAIWLLPSGAAINRHRILYVTPVVDPTGKELEEMSVLLEVGDSFLSMEIKHPKDRTALRQAILALGVEIG